MSLDLETLPAGRQATVCGTLEQHWAMDSLAAMELSVTLTEAEQAHIAAMVTGEEFTPETIAARDKHRADIAAILSGESDKRLVILGPCSLDEATNYSDFFTHIEQLQEQHPDVAVALRLNGSKPRTSKGWRGLMNSTHAAERQALYEAYKEAFGRGIPILTEITDDNEVGSLAPYLSGMWLGARDMASTSLRAVASLIHLPVLIKNGTDGKPDTVRDTMAAIRANTEQNQGSGVNLVIGATTDHRGISTGVLPVGQGNNNIGIVARGYTVEGDLTSAERRSRAIQHIGGLCMLAAEQNSVVLIDGSHGMPHMLAIEKADSTRFPRVMDIVLGAVACGEIEYGDRIRGIIGEVGPNIGRTDPNLVATAANIRIVDQLIRRVEVIGK